MTSLQDDEAYVRLTLRLPFSRSFDFGYNCDSIFC
jgi:hypothetical protein